ncbi:MAG: cupredoxin domain-containing protein [Gammaproteobacteria bacterium]|nr:cupredoxin domain-containing protein [Gammaproteobacteria bacterium]
MSTFIVNLVAVALMGFIVWWFWLSRSNVLPASVSDVIEVIVENGIYSPAQIEVPQGVPVRLSFERRDPSPCAEKVLFDELGVALDLPLGKKIALVVGPLAPGEYRFSCQMQMYRGSLVVK